MKGPKSSILIFVQRSLPAVHRVRRVLPGLCVSATPTRRTSLWEPLPRRGSAGSRSPAANARRAPDNFASDKLALGWRRRRAVPSKMGARSRAFSSRTDSGDLDVGWEEDETGMPVGRPKPQFPALYNDTEESRKQAIILRLSNMINSFRHRG